VENLEKSFYRVKRRKIGVRKSSFEKAENFDEFERKIVKTKANPV
jgi:hypothetical protein